MTRTLLATALFVAFAAPIGFAGPARNLPGLRLAAAAQKHWAAWASPQGAKPMTVRPEEQEDFIALRNEKDPKAILDKTQAFLVKFPQTGIKEWIYSRRFVAYRQLGDTAKAIEAGRQAVEADPQNAIAAYNLGVEYRSSKPPDFNLAVWNLARATALARAANDSSAGQFEQALTQVYASAHGSEEGLPAIIAQAAGSPTPPPGFAVPDPPLYLVAGVAPEDAIQGGLGSCYFHSTMAAIAETSPAKFQEIIHANGDGTYTVRFADNQQETAYTEDLHYARESGFDLSKALWVGVMLRGYAQRVLRDSLQKAVDKSDLFPLVKQYAGTFLTTNDQVLLAYDRAIRAVVDQNGGIDQTKLEAKLKERLSLLPIPDEAKESIAKLLESGGFFQSLAADIKEDGEVFGAYRSIGQGGVPSRVMQAFLGGKTQSIRTDKPAGVPSFLGQAFQAKRPVVAGIPAVELATLKAQKPMPENAKDWYVGAHAYTVMGYDASAGTVTLRNPWGRHPDPDGKFTIPLSTFLNAFGLVQTTAP